MGLKDRLLGLLATGEAPEADPDDVVEIGTVPLTQAPIVVAHLGDAGFLATFVESFNVATSVRSDARIMVRRGDAPAAQELLDSLY